MVGSSSGDLTHCGGSPLMSKPVEDKAMNFENPDGLGTGEEALLQSPWSSKCRGLGPRELISQGKGHVLKSQGLQAHL